MSILHIIKFIQSISIAKTIYFNFHYFKFKVAICFPVFIYRRSELFKMKGTILFTVPIRTGMLRFGLHNLGTQDVLFSRTMWDCSGTLIIQGETVIGRGSKISIGEEATLTIGNHFIITGNSEIICHKAISFGERNLLSWNILMMDTDFHEIRNNDGEIINSPQPIVVGNNVWIGCRSTILKGVHIADNNVIAACSVITNSITQTNCITAGNGKKTEIIKENIEWR